MTQSTNSIEIYFQKFSTNSFRIEIASLDPIAIKNNKIGVSDWKEAEFVLAEICKSNGLCVLQNFNYLDKTRTNLVKTSFFLIVEFYFAVNLQLHKECFVLNLNFDQAKNLNDRLTRVSKFAPKHVFETILNQQITNFDELNDCITLQNSLQDDLVIVNNEMFPSSILHFKKLSFFTTFNLFHTDFFFIVKQLFGDHVVKKNIYEGLVQPAKELLDNFFYKDYEFFKQIIINRKRIIQELKDQNREYYLIKQESNKHREESNT